MFLICDIWNTEVKIVLLLDELDKDKYTKHILRYLATSNIVEGSDFNISADLVLLAMGFVSPITEEIFNPKLEFKTF